MEYSNMTDLRQIEWIKQRLETAIDTLQEIGESSEYNALKTSIVAKTGGLVLEDVIREANRFSKGVNDLETQAEGEEETEREEEEEI